MTVKFDDNVSCDLCVPISFYNCFVDFLNYGHNYTLDVQLSSFLWFLAPDAKIVIINMSFEFNIVLVGANRTDHEKNAGVLLYFEKFSQITLHECKFRYNIGSMSSVVKVQTK